MVVLSSIFATIPPRWSFLPSTFSKGILPLLLVVSMVVSGMPIARAAATTPSLGVAASYAILADTYTNTSATTTISGDIGFTTDPAQVPLGIHPNYGSDYPYSLAGTHQGSALAALASEPCTFTFAPGVSDLSTDTTHGPIGLYIPGVYCSTGAMDAGGHLTFAGNGTYIFRVDGALTSTDASTVTLVGGASACDIFWTPTAATTLGANTTFVGTVIDGSAITVGANTTWTGRALAFGGTVTTDSDTITVPSCSESGLPATAIRLFLRPIISVTTTPEPPTLPGPGAVTYTYTVTNPGLYTMNDISLADDTCSAVNYVSGDTNNDSLLQDIEEWTYSCTAWLSESTTNQPRAAGFANELPAADIGYATVNVGTQLPPPLIHVVKVPNKSVLPFGGGTVTYTYTVSNPGTVALHFVQVDDATCDDVDYISGDNDDSGSLSPDETWTYTCQMYLALTAKDAVTATGNANNETAVDIASAMVFVAPSPFAIPEAMGPQVLAALFQFLPTVDMPHPPLPTIEIPLLPNAGVGFGATGMPRENP